MRKIYLKIALTIFLITASNAVLSQVQLSNNSEISVLTCDAGQELYSLFGHTALRIKDSTNGIDVVYNYGYFDFRTPNFYMKFVKGDLQYFVAVGPYEDFYPQYVYEQRGVYEQQLNLNITQKQKIFADLNAVLSSENRFYTYKFIDRNCTTMVADLINKNIDTKISTQIEDAKKTNRSILYGYVKHHFYENLGINLLFGAKTDKVFDHAFLPLQLMESIKVSKNNGRPLLLNANVINIHSADRNPFSWWNNWYTYLLFFALIIIFNKKSIYLTYFIIAGALGLFMLAVGFVSLHDELNLNYNVLLFNPFLLLVVVFVIKNNKKWILRTSYFTLSILLVYILILANKAHFVLFLPIVLAHIFILVRIIRSCKKVTAA